MNQLKQEHTALDGQIKRLKKKIKQQRSRVIRIALYGLPGAGKTSFLIGLCLARLQKLGVHLRFSE